MELKHTNEELTRLVALPLDDKIQISIARIIEWYETWGGQVYVSYSGGKDSNVLLHLARRVYPDVKAYFVNTGLEYPELQQLVRDTDNVDIVRPKMFFTDVITNYGYPLISKEVSEAIYYARKLGGGKTNKKKRAELRGEREWTGKSQKETTVIGLLPRETTSRWNRGDDCLSNISEWGYL